MIRVANQPQMAKAKKYPIKFNKISRIFNFTPYFANPGFHQT